MIRKKQNIQYLKIRNKLFFILFSFFLSIPFVGSAISQDSNPFLNTKRLKDSLYASGKRSILIVFDASRSMEEKINGETKIHIAKRVLEDVLLKAAPEINLGLRVYGSSKPTNNINFDCNDSRLLILPGTNNRRAIISEIYKILPQGFTPITFSLTQAIQDLAPYNGEKSIILISDGLETCGSDPCELAASLKESQIDLKIDVVGFGVKDDWEAQQQLKCIALNTNGKYISAESDEDLTRGLTESINKSVSGRIITMISKPIEVKSEETEGYENLPKIESEKVNLKRKR